MAIKYYETYPQRWGGPSQDYPQGAFKNLSAIGEQDGSYLEKDWLNDQAGFFGALLRNAEMTPNGLVDTAQRSQFYDALLVCARKAVDLGDYYTKEQVDEKVVNEWGDRVDATLSQEFLTKNSKLISSISTDNKLQYACDTGGVWVIDEDVTGAGVNVTKDVMFLGSGFSFIKQGNTELAGSTADTASFFIINDNVDFRIIGDLTFDGNNVNQPQYSSGFFLRYVYSGGTPSRINIKGMKFKQGTSNYIYVRGDNFQRRALTYVSVENCVFSDCNLGVGAGDPKYPYTVVGYTPAYVLIHDYVDFTSRDCRYEFNRSVATYGEYAPVAVWGSYAGSNYNESGGSTLNFIGTNTLYKMGRGTYRYDGSDLNNNGLGCIDCYGAVDTLYIEHIVAEYCYNIPIRAKASLKYLYVKSANIYECWGGIQVAPSTTGDRNTIAYIDNVNIVGGEMPKLEFIGTNVANKIQSVSINNVNMSGEFTNLRGTPNLNMGNLHFRNVENVVASNIKLPYSPEITLSINTVGNSKFTNIHIPESKSGTLSCIGSGVVSFKQCYIKSQSGKDGVVISGLQSAKFLSCNFDFTASQMGIRYETGGDFTVTDCDIKYGDGVAIRYMGGASQLPTDIGGVITFNRFKGTGTKLVTNNTNTVYDFNFPLS